MPWRIRQPGTDRGQWGCKIARVKNIKRINVFALVGVFVAAALIAFVTALGFYGDFPAINVLASTLMWVMAVVCGIAGWVIRRRIANGEVGMDRSQLNPVTVAQWLALGQAVAWVGAVIGGLYVGVGFYVVPKASTLVAASEDIPGVVSGALSCVAATIAGVWLERSCIAPPPDAPEPPLRSGAAA